MVGWVILFDLGVRDVPIQPYAPPSYWSTYFLGASPAGPCGPSGLVGPPVLPSILSDGVVLVWLGQLLEQLGAFAAVAVGRLAQPRPGQGFPLARVYPIGFNEDDTVDPVELVRVLEIELVLAVRPEDPDDEAAAVLSLDRLSNDAANQILADPIAGVVLGLCRLVSGTYPARDSRDASFGLVLRLEIAYLISGRSGRSTAW